MPRKPAIPSAVRYPSRAAHRAPALPILGASDRRKMLARLTFGKLKIQLTGDELAALNAAAERYVEANGTLYGFARHLLAHVPN